MTQDELEKRLAKTKVTRSRRKTISIEVGPDGLLRVRAPYFTTNFEIDRFIRRNRNWIIRQMDLADKKAVARAAIVPLTAQEIDLLAEQALKELPPRVRSFASQMGVTYGRVTIRNQRTRWGSCSTKGNINLNCLLMLVPHEIQDYVLVHELAHLREMNHSPRFWAIVESVLPDYKLRRKWLRDHGEAIIARLR